MENNYFEIPSCINIRNDRVVWRKCIEDFSFTKKKSALQSKNESHLADHSPSGHMNRKIRMKMNKIIFNWLLAIDTWNLQENPLQCKQITFVTLTLPADQFHEDKFLHQTCLNRLLQTLQRKFNVCSYLWRAEKQKNGNLHYHILVDSFIQWQQLRYEWNHILNDVGYIEKYRNSQQLWHKDGFHVRQELTAKWSEEKQLQAYTRGVKENWNSPNTTDIHALQSINNAAEYICKYVSKSPDVDLCEDLTKARDQGSISPIDYQLQIEPILLRIEKDKIHGRVWGCSDKLKDLKDVKIIECQEVAEFITAIESHPDTRKLVKDNATIYFNKKLNDIVKKAKYIDEIMKAHYINSYRDVYDLQLPVIKPLQWWEVPVELSTVKETCVQVDMW